MSDRPVHIAAAGLTLATTRKLQSSLQAFFPQAMWHEKNSGCSDLHKVSGPCVEITAAVPAWSRAFSRTECDRDDVACDALRRFHHALAHADDDAAAARPDPLTLRVSIAISTDLRVHLHFNVQQASHFTAMFGRFLTLAPLIQREALRLAAQRAVDDLQCTCKQRQGFELKWLDDEQNRYVNQFFDAAGHPASDIEIMHNG